MVRFIFLCFFFLAGVSYLSAQEIQREVLAADGGSAKTNSMQIDWTLGEPVIDDGRTSARWYTAGFQQPGLLVQVVDQPQHAISARSAIAEITVLPNPVSSTLQVKWPDQTENSVTVILSDATGADLIRQSLQPKLGDDQIDMSQYSPGLYLLRFYNTEKELLQVFKISKIQ